MKNALIFSLFLLANHTWANIYTKKVEADIESVTVYIRGAQIFRGTGVYLKKGTNKIIINDVSPYINTKSIQASCSSNALILDAKHHVEYVNPTENEPLPAEIVKRINVLEDTLFYQGLRLDLLRNNLTNYTQEKHLITQNKLLKGEGVGDSLAIFMQAVTFYRSKLQEIESEIASLRVKEHKLESKYYTTQNKLTELRNFKSKNQSGQVSKNSFHQIILTMSTEAEQKVSIDVNYMVARAGWIPSYDLRAKNENNPVKLTYKASIYQKTGMSWDNVKLNLSTYNQECSFSVPELATWIIKDKADYTAQQQGNHNRGYLGISDTTIQLHSNSGYMRNTLMPTTSATANVAFDNSITVFNQTGDNFKLPNSIAGSMEKTLGNVEFKIDTKYTIPSDGQEMMLVVKHTDLESDFNHLTIPKINTDAFLLTNIVNWEKLNLLPAKANIYFNNSYVGETTIDPSTIKDTMSIALGREKGIFTSRKKIEDEEKLVGLTKSNVSRNIEIELVIKNTTNSKKGIVLKDQIPVSKNEKILIKDVDLAGGKLNDETGIIEWNVTLEAGENRKLTFSYTIEHDKEIEVI